MGRPYAPIPTGHVVCAKGSSWDDHGTVPIHHTERQPSSDLASNPSRSIRKKYFLMDRQNKRYGPLAPEEILQLYIHRKISADTRVQKGMYPKLISVKAFLSVYCGSHPEVLRDDLIKALAVCSLAILL